MKIEMIDVESSTIKQIGWSEMRLRVKFAKDSRYEYENVPEKLFLLLKRAYEMNCRVINAPGDTLPDDTISLGSLFNYLVKIHPDKYPFRKLLPSEL
jgi:hypothetical protein